MSQDTLAYENERPIPTRRKDWYRDSKVTANKLRYVMSSRGMATLVVCQDEALGGSERQARKVVFASGQTGRFKARERYATASYGSRVGSSEIEGTFEELASVWRKETGHLSSITKIVMHHAYQSIIGMGPAVVPLLLRRLQVEPEYWFWALTAITRQNPVRPEDAGDIEKMAEAWIQWAKQKGIVF